MPLRFAQSPAHQQVFGRRPGTAAWPPTSHARGRSLPRNGYEGQIEIIGNISARLISAGLMRQDMALRSSGMGFIAGHVATTPRQSHSRWTETLSGYVSYLSNGRLLWINQLT